MYAPPWSFSTITGSYDIVQIHGRSSVALGLECSVYLLFRKIPAVNRHRMAIYGVKGIADLFLYPPTIAAVFDLAVNGVPGDAEHTLIVQRAQRSGSLWLDKDSFTPPGLLARSWKLIDFPMLFSVPAEVSFPGAPPD